MTEKALFTGPGPQIVFANPSPGYGSVLVFTSPGEDFTATAVTSTITITATTTTTTTAIATTTNDNNNNKVCIRCSKIHIKWPLKDIWWKSQVLFQ